MSKGRGQHSNVIKGPIGKETPFKLQRNDDGTPNYRLSVRMQQEAANKLKETPNAGRYSNNLAKSIADIQKLKQAQEAKFADRQPVRNYSKSQIEHQREAMSISQSISKQALKNEPIKR